MLALNTSPEGRVVRRGEISLNHFQKAQLRYRSFVSHFFEWFFCVVVERRHGSYELVYNRVRYCLWFLNHGSKELRKDRKTALCGAPDGKDETHQGEAWSIFKCICVERDKLVVVLDEIVSRLNQEVYVLFRTNVKAWDTKKCNSKKLRNSGTFLWLGKRKTHLDI